MNGTGNMESPDDEQVEEAVAAVESLLGRGWREQYDRMLRWFERLHEQGEIDERRRDDFYAFFLICFHLKDWLKNDPAVQQSLPDIDKTVEAFINGKPALRLCADLANGVKHLARDKPNTVRFADDALLSVAPSAFQTDAFDAGSFQVSGEIVAKAAGQRWDAEMVASSCVAHWQNFLRSERLLPDDATRPP